MSHASRYLRASAVASALLFTHALFAPCVAAAADDDVRAAQGVLPGTKGFCRRV